MKFLNKSCLKLGGMLTTLLASQSLYAEVDCSGITSIGQIQGATHVSPYNNTLVETCGVVTAVAFNGYYLQDPEGDGDPATADGIFVLKYGSKPEVGTMLRLRDVVTEYIPGGVSTGNLSTTNLTYPTILASEEGYELPKPVIIGRSGRIPPNKIVISEDEIDPPINLQNLEDAAANTFNPYADGIDFYESLEGMMVTVEQPVAVSAVRQFGTFSAEVFVLANNGKDAAPKNARTSRGGINLQPDVDNTGDQNPERVQLQFDSTLFGSTAYPSIKVGDKLGDVTGVVGYSFGNYEVNALGTFDIKPGNIKVEQTRNGPLKDLTVASYNVLNLSAVASDDNQRAVVASHIALNLRSPDVVALQEIQDNNGDISDCPSSDPSACSEELDANLTLELLINAIEQAGGPVYEYINVNPLVETNDMNRDDPDTFGGISLGNIRNAFLYNPQRVSLVEYTGLTRDVLAKRGVSENRAFDTSRDPLEAVFNFEGEKVTVINNHFSSRFGSTPIFGGVQPFIQAAEPARESQALAINQLVTNYLDDDDDRHVIVLGDLNTFEFTNDLLQILPSASGEEILYNLVELNRDDNNYSFIFEGNSQVLDHIFATEDLAEHARFDFVHVNVDFPRLSSDVIGSDHEPVIAGFRFSDEDEDEGDED